LHIIHPVFLSKRKRRLILEKYFYRKSKKRTFRINARSFFPLKAPPFFMVLKLELVFSIFCSPYSIINIHPNAYSC